MTMNPETKIERKALAAEPAREIGAQVKYLGVPSCAYQVGPYTINKDASISGDDFEAIRDFLIRHDYIHREPAAPIEEEPAPTDSEHDEAHIEAEPAPADSEPDEAVIEAEPTPADLETDEFHDDAHDDVDAPAQTNVSVPISELNVVSLVNLIKLVYAKQALIAAMTRSDFIFIDEEVCDLLNDTKPDCMEQIQELVESETRVNMIRGLDLKEDRVTFTFPFDGDDPTAWASYAKLLLALIKRAKEAKHITAKRIDPAESEMKYYCKGLLNQLGFGGPDFKADRAALLGHLTGWAAFKTDAAAKEHTAKYAERRRAARLSEKAEGDLEAPAASDDANVSASEGVIA